MHTIGWPLPKDVYGGSWMYHLHDNQVSIGIYTYIYIYIIIYLSIYPSPSSATGR